MAGLRLEDTERGRGQWKKASMPFPSRGGRGGRVDQSEPVTLLDKDMSGHLALRGWQSSVPGRWAG